MEIAANPLIAPHDIDRNLARAHQQVLIRHTELRGIDRPPEGAGAALPG